MPVAIVVAAAITSQAIKANGARKAAKAQIKGIEAGKRDLNEGYDKAATYQQPYVDAGKQTLGQLAAGLQDGGEFNRKYTMEDFQADPGYEFRQQEGQKGVERSAAARGGALSGAAIKAANQYGQNLASQEYQSAYQRYNNDLAGRFSRLSSIASMGQHAADVSSGMEAERGTSLGNLSINKGNVKAAQQTAYATAAANANQSAANAIAGGMGGGMGGMMSNMGNMGNMGGQSGGSTIGDYTGAAYGNWLNNQNAAGGTTSYGR